jgi:hypothetical protein
MKRSIMKDRIGGIARWTGLAGLIVLAVALSFRPSHAGPQPRDGSHDFDWEVGHWNTHLEVLRRNADGTEAWARYEGTSNVIPIWNCRAEMVELDATGPGGRRLQAINLRLYDPQSGQWSLNFANVASGEIGVPTVGEFRNGIGTFYDQESIGGRTVLVRAAWSGITANTGHFEQAISDDGGKTWKLNWIADDTRVAGTTDECEKGAARQSGPAS